MAAILAPDDQRQMCRSALPSVIGGRGKDFNGVSGIGPAMAAGMLGRRRGLAHRRWSELGKDRA